MSARRMKAVDVKAGYWLEVKSGKTKWSWQKVQEVVGNGEHIVFSTAKGKFSFDFDDVVIASPTDSSGIPNRVEVPDWDEYFLLIAVAVSKRAKCRRRQVGAVLVDNSHRVLGCGYNGFAPGTPTDCLSGGCPRGLTAAGVIPPDSPYTDTNSSGFCSAIHAESNVLLWTAGSSTVGSTMYVTDKPCPDCMRFIAGAGIVRVVWPKGELDPMDFYKIGGIL